MPRERDRRDATIRIKELHPGDPGYLRTLRDIYRGSATAFPPQPASPYQQLTDEEIMLRDSINASREKRGY